MSWRPEAVVRPCVLRYDPVIVPTLVLLLSLLQPQPSAAEQPARSAYGFVVDSMGAPVAGAEVVSVSEPACATTSATDGRFSLVCERPVEAVRVLAAGFTGVSVPAATSAARARLRIVLESAPHTETVIVTATRAEGQEVSRAAPVSTLTSGDLALSPPAPLDDLLRTVPGFSLFRRSSSRVSNPTTQGATLRGLGGSGASRALVLADGLPLNDPFGGWVAWNRVPLASIERVEVVRGGASDLYGADALAGVVQVLTIRPATPTLRAEVTGGSRGTARGSAFAGTVRGRWEATFAAEAATTDGYVLVPEGERGAVDVEAGGRYATGRAGVGYGSAGWHMRASGHVFIERRDNGTPLQENETEFRQARLDAEGEAKGGRWRARLHTGDQTYRQTFSAIAADREAETLTLQQRVPASEHGVMVEWARQVARVDVLVGGDLRQTEGTNHEQGFLPDGRRRTPTSAPAFQRTGGLFAHATYRPRGDLLLTIGGRGDVRERERAARLSDADGRLSPRMAVAWTVAPAVVVRGGASWSFRAPTLNERFRGFRVGSVLTLPNPDLRPESLRTVEGSVFLLPRAGSMRMTVFRSDLDDGVANVTVTSTPDLITRRRENVGGIAVVGAEIEGEWRWRATASITASGTLLDSRFVDDPALADLRVPQVPRWQGGVGLRWLAPRDVTLAAQLRVFGRQFEDDRNTLTLGRGAVLDLTAARPIGRGASILVAVENLLNTTYDVGRTPARTVGQPFTAHAGVRLDLRK